MLLGILLLTMPWVPINKPTSSAENLVASIGTTMLGLFLMIIVINSFITGKHFDKVWKQQLINDELAKKLFFSLVLSTKYSLVPRAKRGLIYASHVVLKNKSKKNALSRQIFNGYDFRAMARGIDKIFSFLLFYLLFGGVGMFGVVGIIKLSHKIFL